MLEMNRGQLDQIVPMPPQGAKPTDLIVRAKRAAQKTCRMQILNPLAVFDVGLLPSRYVLQMLSID